MNICNLALLVLFQFSFSVDQAVKSPQSPVLPDSVFREKQKVDIAGAANIIFKSTDGGETWQDISAGLPVNMQADGFIEKESDLYVSTENGIYHGKANSTAPFWQKEISPDGHTIAPGKTGILAYNYGGQFLQKVSGTGLWLPMYTNLQQKEIRTIFETGTTVFIGSDNGLLKSNDNGKSWKQVYNGGWVMKMVESNGILMATSQSGILRSTDGGETWNCVISEGGVGIAIERIEGGFAAISCNTQSETRRVRTSYDGGKTWQPIDAGLPASLFIASIVQVDKYLFCGHPNGIFRSSDKGKTWQLLLPAIEDKVFNLSVSGKVIYAMPKGGGC